MNVTPLLVPPGVVALTAPVVAPTGTVVEIWLSESTVKTALTPWNVTAVAPVKLVPAIVTGVPTGPLGGVRDAMNGVTLKSLVLTAVPFGVTTLIGPVVAPLGTVAVICVSESTVKEVAGVPLNLTAVAPVKVVPVMVTAVPTGPLPGVNDVICGVTVNGLALVAVPLGVVTWMVPVVAPIGTVAVISVSEPTVKVALTPLKLTAVAPVKPVPLILTLVPTGADPGEKDVIVGGGTDPTSWKTWSGSAGSSMHFGVPCRSFHVVHPVPNPSSGFCQAAG
jgi:hypothetical protein